MAFNRRKLAQPFIRGGVERGLSTRQIQRVLRNQGLTYRRTNFLADIRTYRHARRVRPTLQAVRKDLYPSENLYSSPRAYMRANYRYNTRVEFRHRVTGERRSMYRWVESDIPLTPGQAEREAWHSAARDLDPSLYDVTRVTIWDAYKKPGLRAK